MTDPAADQNAAAVREAAHSGYRATLDGEPVTVRPVSVEASPEELAALERGEMPPGIRAQLDRQGAEDATIAALEKDVAP